MTLYYTLVFVLLMTEMALFMLLILPLPFSLRRKMFNFISENPIVAKIQYGMKITFISILILFIDSVNRVYRVQVELASVAESNSKGGAVIMGHERLEVQARKFYSQRNMYLCGFTLFLSLILNRTYTLILDQLHLEEKLKYLQAHSKSIEATLKADSESADARLDKALKDVEAMRAQSQGLAREYDALATRHNATQAKDGSTKKDR